MKITNRWLILRKEEDGDFNIVKTAFTQKMAREELKSEKEKESRLNKITYKHYRGLLKKRTFKLVSIAMINDRSHICLVDKSYY